MTKNLCARDGCEKPPREYRGALYCSVDCKQQAANARLREKLAQAGVVRKRKKRAPVEPKRKAAPFISCQVCRTWKCTRHPQKVTA